MVKHSPSLEQLADPYSFLAITVLEEAFRNIKAYYTRRGTKEELLEGRKSLRWMRRMEGTFKLVAAASGRPIESFHQKCLWKINEIKNEALKELK